MDNSGPTTPKPPPLQLMRWLPKMLKGGALLVGLLGLGAAGVELASRAGVDTSAKALTFANDLLQRMPGLTDALGSIRLVADGMPTRHNESAETPVTTASTTPAEPKTPAEPRTPADSQVVQQTPPASPQAPAPASGASPSSSSDTVMPPQAKGRPFAIGDKLKLAFYERVDVEADKWGRAGSSMRGFEERPELSGEFTVQEDGTISLPLLGSFPVADQTAQDLQAALASSFEALTGRKGLVTVLSLERPPVYVLGPLKNPGAYKHAPGMTVFHVVALAGGFDRQGIEPWQRVEAVREIEKRRGAIEAMSRLIAHAAVLKSERDGATARPPVRLLELIGEPDARKLIADESERRALIVFARRNRERAIATSIDAAKTEVQMLSNRLRPLDDLIKLRAERANDIRSLVASRVVGRTLLIQAQSELSDAEQRRQDAVNQYTMAQQRLSVLEQERARFEAETASEIDAQITSTEQQIALHEREFATSEGVLGALVTRKAAAETAGDQRYGYEIVRQTATGPVSFASDGMTLLQPGDLVRIIAPSESQLERGRADPGKTAQAGPPLLNH